jgi:nitronate monooxygenase
MREAGMAADDPHRMQMPAGQSAAMAKPLPAADLVKQIWNGARSLLTG